MSEEKIKIIEKKVDLLYRLHLENEPHMEIDLWHHLDELIPLFNLSIEMEKIKIKGFIVEKLIEDAKKVQSELDKLKSDREAGNFLAKDKDKMGIMINNYEEKFKVLEGISESYMKVKSSKEVLRNELLKINLKEKLGMKLLDESIHKDTLDMNFIIKKELEEELKYAIDNFQEDLKEYKEEFD